VTVATVRIRVLSDLHIEFEDWAPPPVEADVIILAGDIHVGVRGVEWAQRRFPHTPVVYIAGNHEFYGARLEDLRQDLVRRGRECGVNVLDGDEVVIGGARILGATLWTDFALHGSDAAALNRAMADARRGMHDYRVIRHADGAPLCPEDTRALHLQQLHWLGGKLGEPFTGPTVVVTHHLPHSRSIHAKYAGSRLNPAFASDLGGLFGPPVALWVHGHTHESIDYVEDGTRVVCNPRGYSPMELNESFNPVLTVEVPVARQGPIPGADGGSHACRSARHPHRSRGGGPPAFSGPLPARQASWR